MSRAGGIRLVVCTVFIGLIAIACEKKPASSDDGRSCAPQCIRAVTCRKGGCGGPVMSTGCCGCLPGEVDDITCSVDAGDSSKR